MDLLEDKSIPALYEAGQVVATCGLLRVTQDKAQRRGLGNGTEGTQKVTGLERGENRSDFMFARKSEISVDITKTCLEVLVD